MTGFGGEFHGFLMGSTVPTHGNSDIAGHAQAAWGRMADAVRRMRAPPAETEDSPDMAKEITALRDSSIDRWLSVS